MLELDEKGRSVWSGPPASTGTGHLRSSTMAHLPGIERQPVSLASCCGDPWSSPWKLSPMMTIRKSAAGTPASRPPG